VKTLVDTSSWVEALRKDGRQDVRARVHDLVLAGDAVLCDMVLLELWNGVRGEKERLDLAAIEEDLEIVPTSAAAWQLANEIARRSRVSGRTLPATDILIAACAGAAGTGVEAVDPHVTEAWHIAAGVPRPS
jgi:predicted nucleic acid-binding protein